MQGKYVVIEGPDGTGKTTQAELLEKTLAERGISCIHVKEPGGTPIGEEVRKVILDGNLDRTPMTNLLLFTAIRHELWESTIKPALAAGTWVICTRNYWSSIAFQGYGEGMDIDLITETTQIYTDERYLHPDIGVVLNFDNETEKKRRIAERGQLAAPDTFESKADGFIAKVNKGYAELATLYNIPVLNAAEAPHTVAAKLNSLVFSDIDN